MLLKILSQIIFRHFTIKATNLVFSFYFLTRLFNLTNANEKLIFYNKCFKQVCPQSTQHQVAARKTVDSLLHKIKTKSSETANDSLRAFH